MDLDSKTKTDFYNKLIEDQIIITNILNNRHSKINILNNDIVENKGESMNIDFDTNSNLKPWIQSTTSPADNDRCIECSHKESTIFNSKEMHPSIITMLHKYEGMLTSSRPF